MRSNNFCTLISVLIFVYLAQTSLAINCGTFEVCVNVGPSTTTVSVTVNAIPVVLGGPVLDVDTSGYLVNANTGDGGALVAPPGVTTHTWTGLTTGTGDIVVGFPATRVYGPAPADMCYISFRKEPTVSVGFNQCWTEQLQKSTSIDFALVVDDTGSMSDDITSVVTQANQILNALNSVSTSFRSALVTYNDPSPAPVATNPTAATVQTFVPGVTAVQTALAAITPNGGGDTPECMYDGLIEALLLFWDPAAVRMTLTMGDAPAKTCKNSLQDVLLVANAFDVTVDLSPSTPVAPNVPLSVRAARRTKKVSVPVRKLNRLSMVPIRTGATATFEELAAGTGGTTIRAASTADVVPSIIQAITGSPATRPSPTPYATTRDLSVTRVCPDQRSAIGIAITNPNAFDVPYKYREIYTRTMGTGIAPPGRSTLELKKKSSRSTQVLFSLQWDKKERGRPSGTERALVRSDGCKSGSAVDTPRESSRVPVQA